jgi:phenylpyruvate tautomerase
MPLIKVQTSVSITADQSTTVLKQLSAQLSSHTGKPETYVMAMLEGDVFMTLGGTSDPSCYIEIKNIGTMMPEQTQAMSQTFSQQIHQMLGIPPSRTYIEFSDIRGSMWGWNGATFG